MTKICIFYLTPVTNQWCNCGESQKLLGVHITKDLIWTLNTCLAKKSQQHLHFLQRMKRANLPPLPLSTGSAQTSCLSVWSGTCTVSNCRNLQCNGRTAEKIIRVSLPTFDSIYQKGCICKPTSIMDDHSHSSHGFFHLAEYLHLADAFKWFTVVTGYNWVVQSSSSTHQWLLGSAGIGPQPSNKHLNIFTTEVSLHQWQKVPENPCHNHQTL